MSNQSKALQLVKNNFSKKVMKLIDNDFYLDGVENDDNEFTFNKHINDYILLSKKTKKDITYYFTLEKFMSKQEEGEEVMYLCVWFKNDEIRYTSNYNINVETLMNLIEDQDHHKNCEGNIDEDCRCDYCYEHYNYLYTRQGYSIQYYKRLSKKDIDISIKTEKQIDIDMKGLFDFVINFKMDICENCKKLEIEDDLSENLCNTCLLKIDENMSEYPDECSICYDNDCLKFKVKTPCNHTFHKECLKKCRETRIKECNSNCNECPYCRTENVRFFNSDFLIV